MTSALTDKGSTRKWRSIRMRILNRDHWTCQWCGAPGTTVGHLVPRRLGGGDEAGNLAASCVYHQQNEMPLPSRLHKLRPADALAPTPPRVEHAQDAPGRPVTVYGRRRPVPSPAVSVGQRAIAGRTLGESRRGLTFFRNEG